MPFLTPAEYKSSPNAVDYGNIDSSALGQQSGAQDAQLRIEIDKAGGWIESTWCNQGLLAKSRTEATRATPTRGGEFIVTPAHQNCLLQLTSWSYGTTASTLTAGSLTDVWIERKAFHLPTNGAGGSFPGLQLARITPGDDWVLQLAYVSGWVGTTLTANATAGATSVTVADPTGVKVGGTSAQLRSFDGLMTIYDPPNTETVTVTSVNGSMIGVTALANAHTAGCGFSNLPGEVKAAAVMVVSAFIKMPGSDAIAMGNGMSPGPAGAMDPVASSSLKMAREMLASYRKIR